MSAPTADYDALGRETAQAFTSGRLDAEGLAEVCRAVLDLDPARALSLVRSNPSANRTGVHHA